MNATGRTLSLILGLSLAFGLSAARAADKFPRVELDTSAGKIVLELNADKAPISVENFLKYVDEGFYANTTFHRVIPGFMVQGGAIDDKMNEKRDPSQGVHPSIKNESSNGLSNARGTVAMARTNNPDSATCQFFINHADNPRLDTYGGGYAVFGKVVEGMDVVDAIAKTPTTSKGGYDDVPVKPVYIKAVKRVNP
ncbi:peptidylprolyl isomerase [Paludisphaera rhizosphaerae]|uniref:peptidylprolyl isomerase n=1 Tax=Paludisphaera rhizosphaerae TaxID=2711216 RepID=UPI0013EC9B9E|nr:peptidylprolyl isomerase [Paludisphaera rhizosphaerae]